LHDSNKPFGPNLGDQVWISKLHELKGIICMDMY